MISYVMQILICMHACLNDLCFWLVGKNTYIGTKSCLQQGLIDVFALHLRGA